MIEIINPVGKFLDPLTIIAQLEINKGAVVADFGCGPGYFTFPFAKAVGTDGLVYSFDILPQVLETVSSKAKFSGTNNVITRRANLENIDGTKLGTGSVDWVILKDILFQNKKKQAIVKEAYRILKPGGKILVIEWSLKDLTIGPDLGVRIPEEKLRELFEIENFSIEKSIEAGSFHSAFIATKNK
jgi:ubiquinone/menaquinone biosynthesis C-methylase UbiE